MKKDKVKAQNDKFDDKNKRQSTYCAKTVTIV
jgi:hypothetical protein